MLSNEVCSNYISPVVFLWDFSFDRFFVWPIWLFVLKKRDKTASARRAWSSLRALSFTLLYGRDSPKLFWGDNFVVWRAVLNPRSMTLSVTPALSPPPHYPIPQHPPPPVDLNPPPPHLAFATLPRHRSTTPPPTHTHTLRPVTPTPPPSSAGIPNPSWLLPTPTASWSFEGNSPDVSRLCLLSSIAFLLEMVLRIIV